MKLKFGIILFGMVLVSGEYSSAIEKNANSFSRPWVRFGLPQQIKGGAEIITPPTATITATGIVALPPPSFQCCAPVDAAACAAKNAATPMDAVRNLFNDLYCCAEVDCARQHCLEKHRNVIQNSIVLVEGIIRNMVSPICGGAAPSFGGGIVPSRSDVCLLTEDEIQFEAAELDTRYRFMEESIKIYKTAFENQNCPNTAPSPSAPAEGIPPSPSP